VGVESETHHDLLFHLLGISSIEVLTLEVLENVFWRGSAIWIIIDRSVLGLAWLDEGLLDLHVLGDDGVPPRSLSEAVVVLLHIHLHGLSESKATIWNDFDVLQLLRLGPLVHDERVVHRQAVDLVHPKALELIEILFESWQLVGGTGRSEGTWKGEEHNLLSREELLRGHVLPTKRVWLWERIIPHPRVESDARQLLWNAKGHYHTAPNLCSRSTSEVSRG